MRPLTRFRPLLVLVAVFLMLSQLIGAGAVQSSVNELSSPDRTTADRGTSANAPKPSIRRNEADGKRKGDQDDPDARDDAFYSRRTAGDHPISVAEAAAL